MEFTGITFAGAGQDLDTGAKVVHAAPNTSSHITTKSIARDGGVSNFRSSITVLPNATGSKSAVSCESLMLDDRSRSDTIPEMDIRCDAVDVGHEAKIGRISEEAVFYLMSRGLSEEDAPGPHRGRLCRAHCQGAARGVRRGDEQPHPSGNERQHWLKGGRER